MYDVSASLFYPPPFEFMTMGGERSNGGGGGLQKRRGRDPDPDWGQRPSPESSLLCAAKKESERDLFIYTARRKEENDAA